MSTSRKPQFYAYAVVGEGEKASWTKIGAAWAHGKGGGFNVDLDALPVNGRIVLKEPKPREGDDK